MSENTKNEIIRPKETELDQKAQSYIDTVRELYRSEKGQYRGQRTPDQSLIAEWFTSEAPETIRAVAVGAVAVFNLAFTGAPDAESIGRAYDASLESGDGMHKKSVNEFTRLLVGFGVITNRLSRDGHLQEPQFFDLPDDLRMRVSFKLMNDFIALNALRWGIIGSGVKKAIRRHNDDGGIDVTTIDPDLARTKRAINDNFEYKGFVEQAATHPLARYHRRSICD